jgi:hypothetical protein
MLHPDKPFYDFLHDTLLQFEDLAFILNKRKYIISITLIGKLFHDLTPHIEASACEPKPKKPAIPLGTLAEEQLEPQPPPSAHPSAF